MPRHMKARNLTGGSWRRGGKWHCCGICWGSDTINVLDFAVIGFIQRTRGDDSWLSSGIVGNAFPLYGEDSGNTKNAVPVGQQATVLLDDSALRTSFEMATGSSCTFETTAFAQQTLVGHSCGWKTPNITAIFRMPRLWRSTRSAT